MSRPWASFQTPWGETSREWSARRQGIGSSYARRRRRNWLLREFGDGSKVRCYWGCGATLSYSTLTVDRIIAGRKGGTYRRDNIVPSCLACNCARDAWERANEQ